MAISLLSCFSNCGAIFEHFNWRHFLGMFQALVALLAFALAFGVYRPAGPITLHTIPAVHNPVWLLTFASLGISGFIWAIVGVWQLGIVRHLEQYPTLFRFWILFDLALELTCAGVVTAYIISVLHTSEGCLNRSKEGCSTAWAFTVFEALWGVVEAVAFGVLIAKYIGRDESYERPDRKGEWKIWVRGAQVLCASLSVALSTLLYLPTGIPVVNGIRSPTIVWILLLGAILCGIFLPWHLAMCFPGIRRSMYRSYGLYVFYVVMECFALVAYLSIGAVYAWKFLTKGSACADIGQQGCPAILATDAFTSIAGVMQIAQIIALMFMLDKRPPKPVKVKEPKIPKQPKQPRQAKQPKQRYQPPAGSTYAPESYIPPESYPRRRYPQQSYPQQSYPQERYPRQRYPQERYPYDNYPGLQPPPPSYAFNKKPLDSELEEAQFQEQLNKERWKRDMERLRAESKALRNAQKREAKRQREIEQSYEKERKRAAEVERLRKQARMREEQIERLKEHSREEDEAPEHEDDAWKQPDEITRLQARVREEGDQLLRILERQKHAGPDRQEVHEIAPPPSYDYVAQGNRWPRSPTYRQRQNPREEEPDLLDQVYREWEMLEEKERHRASIFD